jgi:hypothetical protein
VPGAIETPEASVHGGGGGQVGGTCKRLANVFKRLMDLEPDYSLHAASCGSIPIPALCTGFTSETPGPP